MAMVIGYLLLGFGVGFCISGVRGAMEAVDAVAYAQGQGAVYMAFCALGLLLTVIGGIVIARSVAKGKRERQRAQEARSMKAGPAVCPACGNNLAEGCTQCPFCE